MSADISQLSIKVLTDRFDGGLRWIPCELNDVNTRIRPKDVQDFHIIYKGQEIDLERILKALAKANANTDASKP